MSVIDFEHGKYGVRAILKSAWSQEAGDQLRRHGCSELELNYAKGWTGTDLSFLGDFRSLKAFTLIDWTITSVRPIHELRDLRALEIMTYCDTELVFSAFPNLESCAIEWREKAASLFGCTSLRTLFVNSYDGRNLLAFTPLQILESFAALNAPLESLDGVSAFRNLRSLRLGNLKRLRSLAGIEFLTKIEELDINTCPALTSIEQLSASVNLRHLNLNNCGKISSLQPLDGLQQLESVVFYESTNIVDGDISPLSRLKKLNRVSFQNRRHYSHKREEFGAAYFGSSRPRT